MGDCLSLIICYLKSLNHLPSSLCTSHTQNVDSVVSSFLYILANPKNLHRFSHSLLKHGQCLPAKPIPLQGLLRNCTAKPIETLITGELGRNCVEIYPRSEDFEPGILPKPVFRVQFAADDDQWGPEKDEPVGESSAVAVSEEEKPVEPAEIAKLKKALVDSFYGTDRGLKASSKTRAGIVELTSQLDAQNPNQAPTEALSLLNENGFLRTHLFQVCSHCCRGVRCH